jgi:hypothetical protein
MIIFINNYKCQTVVSFDLKEDENEISFVFFLNPFRNVVVCKRRAYERDLIEKKKDTTSMLFQAHNGQNKKRERERKERNLLFFSFLHSFSLL